MTVADGRAKSRPPVRYEVKDAMRGYDFVVRAMRGSRRVGHVAVMGRRPWGDPRRHLAESGACSLALLAAERAAGKTLGVLAVTQSDLAETEWNTGVGVGMYALAVEEAGRRGAVLAADRCQWKWPGSTSQQALRVWRSRRLAQRVTVFNGILAYHSADVQPGAVSV